MRYTAAIILIMVLNGCSIASNPPQDLGASREAAEIRVWQTLYEGSSSPDPAQYRDEALRRIRVAVDLGGTQSMRYLALYLIGRGGTDNLRQAEDWLRRAGETVCEAHIDLALLWLDGVGGHAVDGAMGRHYLQKAAQTGECPQAHAILGQAMADGRILTDRPAEDALDEVLKPAEGQCGACLLVAGELFAGKHDWDAAVRAWRAAAKAGDSRAAARLGQAYQSGLAPGDRQTALGWLMASRYPLETLDATAIRLAAAMPDGEVAQARLWARDFAYRHLSLAQFDAQTWRGMLDVLGAP